MASAPKRRNTPQIPLESLRVADVAGVKDPVIAEQHGVSERTVRRARKRATDAYPSWPHVPAIVGDTPTACDAREDMDATHPLAILAPPADESPDALEALACAALIASARMPGQDRIPAARALLELAKDRRSRGVGTGPARSPEEIAAAAQRAILSATENVPQRD